MKIKEYTIANEFIEVKFLNLGAIITEINYKGINRVLKFQDYNSYLNNTMYLGAVVGRTAGRIKNGEYELGKLQKNFLGKHNLHGNNMNLLFYDVDCNLDSAVLNVVDKEGDFNGDLNVEIKYLLEGNSLFQYICGNCDEPTLINMTNHSYFNLNGEGSILDHEMKIDASHIGVLNDEMLTVDFKELKTTAFDFTSPRTVRNALIQGDEQFTITGFIDHPYKLTGAISLWGSDCKMEIQTNQPYVVAYLGSQIDKETQPLANNDLSNYHGLCLEPQKCPGDTLLVTSYEYCTKYTFN